MLVGRPSAAVSRCAAALRCLRRRAGAFKPLRRVRYLLRCLRRRPECLWWRVERLSRRGEGLGRRVRVGWAGPGRMAWLAREGLRRRGPIVGRRYPRVPWRRQRRDARRLTRLMASKCRSRVRR